MEASSHSERVDFQGYYTTDRVRVSLQFGFVPCTGDQRVLSPLVSNKQLYLPVPSSLTELSDLELKQSTGSLSGLGETSIHTPTKSRPRPSSHIFSSHASGNSENFSLVSLSFTGCLIKGVFQCFLWVLREVSRPLSGNHQKFFFKNIIQAFKQRLFINLSLMKEQQQGSFTYVFRGMTVEKKVTLLPSCHVSD